MSEGRRRDTSQPLPAAGVRVGVPLAVFAVVLVAAVGAWRVATREARRSAEAERVRLANELADRVEARLAEDTRDAAAVVDAFMHAPEKDRAHFVAAVNAHAARARAWMTAAWLDRERICLHVVRPAGDAAEDPSLRPTTRPAYSHRWLGVIDAKTARAYLGPRVVYAEFATQAATAATTTTATAAASAAQLFVVTPAVSGEGESAAMHGSLALRLDVGRAVDGFAARTDDEAGYDVDLSDGRAVLARRGQPIDGGDGPPAAEAPVHAFDRVWRLRVRPTPATAARQAGASAAWVLYLGVALAAAAGWGTHAATRRWSRSLADARRQVDALSTVAQTAGAISAEPGAGREAMQRLAESARQVLGVQMATVCVVDEKRDRIEVMARVGQQTPLQPPEYSLDVLPVTRRCLTEGRVMVVDDVDTDPAVNKRPMHDMGIRSGMWIPLTVEGRVIGLLFLGHPHAHAFGEAERQVAAVLASQAGVILSNSRLSEQKDAALAAQVQLAKRHEALYSIAAEIYGSEDLAASLRRLVDTAPAVLGVDLCSVSLRVGTDQSKIVAITGNYANCTGETHAGSESNAGRVWRTRAPLVIADGPNDASLNPTFRHRLHVGSVIYLPLIVGDGPPIGTMVLIRHEPGEFTAEQLDLANVLAARAAAAIHTATLHDVARRAADTQTMLLRELNHRVKNNLSSIVALLSMDRPAMSAESLAWINRLTDRVNTMSRTHELFVGGNDRVPLAELVQKLLPAFALIKPGGADVRTDLGGVHCDLDTQRAVSLAMVLNELCWNALEHGTRSGGTLWIRARSPEESRLELEVEDGGPGDREPDAAEPVPRSNNPNGVGLRLVEGLVQRELKGRLSFSRTSAGGTLARIEIPVEICETPGISVI
jgi:two-component sensor histidine kinase